MGNHAHTCLGAFALLFLLPSALQLMLNLIFSFRLQLKCHILRGAFPDCSIYTVNCYHTLCSSPIFFKYMSLSEIVLHPLTCLCII